MRDEVMQPGPWRGLLLVVLVVPVLTSLFSDKPISWRLIDSGGHLLAATIAFAALRRRPTLSLWRRCVVTVMLIGGALVWALAEPGSIRLGALGVIALSAATAFRAPAQGSERH